VYEKILNYLQKNIYPFHMPGHKGRAEFFPPEGLQMDLTEIPGMDVLSAPVGIIGDFQRKAANFFGASHSFFLVNGASVGNLATVCALVSGRKIFVARNSHVSLYNGLVISGASPTYFLPEITPGGLAGGVSPDTFENLPENAAVFLVSPTYEGFVSDIAEIAKRVHARGGILCVDEAHGAHFPFHAKFPTHALACGADIVVNSLHKTLPAVSGCGFLHVNSSRVDVARLRFFLNALQTTSPSYMLMAACDFMLEKLWREPEWFQNYTTRLEKLRKELAAAKKMRLLGSEMIGSSGIFAMDEGKLLFEVGAPAEEISDFFAREYKLQFEMAQGKHLLAMTSVADTDEGFARLVRAATDFSVSSGWCD